MILEFATFIGYECDNCKTKGHVAQYLTKETATKELIAKVKDLPDGWHTNGVQDACSAKCANELKSISEEKAYSALDKVFPGLVAKLQEKYGKA